MDLINKYSIRACFLLGFITLTPVLLKAQAPVVSFSSANGGSIQEGVGALFMSVNIMNPNANETTVQIQHMGTATYGEDYTTYPDTIVFPPGSAASQSLHMNFPDDCLDESNETIILKLVNPTNGAQLGIATITTSLLDDDTQPVASCTYTVPSNIGVVTNSFSYFNHNGKFWVCQTGNLRLRSNNNIAVVENGGVVHAEKDNNVIYAKSGGTVLVEGGDQNVIYAEDGATITVQSGMCNSVFASPGVVYTDNGSGTVSYDLPCAPLNLDYSLAPVPGCMISAEHDPVRKLGIDIFPNPTSGPFEIHHDDDAILQHIQLFDSHGIFLKVLPANEHNLSVSPGVYYLRCVFNTEVAIQRIVVGE